MIAEREVYFGNGAVMSQLKTIKNLIREALPVQTRATARRLLTQTEDAYYRFLSRTIICRVGDYSIRIGVSNGMEAYRARTYATKEPETLAWLREHLRDGDVFFDIGANIGLYSLYAATITPTCRVFAFEPESQNYARLCRNVVVNRLDNVVPCNVPVSNRECFDYFYVGEFRPGEALHGFGAPNPHRSAPGPLALRQGSLGSSIDALVDRFHMPQPALVKIDVDGNEEEIVRGAAAVLQRSQTRSVLVEVTWQSKRSAVEDMLEAWGFAARNRGRLFKTPDGQSAQNIVFVRSEK